MKAVVISIGILSLLSINACSSKKKGFNSSAKQGVAATPDISIPKENASPSKPVVKPDDSKPGESDMKPGKDDPKVDAPAPSGKGKTPSEVKESDVKACIAKFPGKGKYVVTQGENFEVNSDTIYIIRLSSNSADAKPTIPSELAGVCVLAGDSQMNLDAIFEKKVGFVYFTIENAGSNLKMNFKGGLDEGYFRAENSNMKVQLEGVGEEGCKQIKYDEKYSTLDRKCS